MESGIDRTAIVALGLQYLQDADAAIEAAGEIAPSNGAGA